MTGFSSNYLSLKELIKILGKANVRTAVKPHYMMGESGVRAMPAQPRCLDLKPWTIAVREVRGTYSILYDEKS